MLTKISHAGIYISVGVFFLAVVLVFVSAGLRLIGKGSSVATSKAAAQLPVLALYLAGGAAVSILVFLGLDVLAQFTK